MTGVEVVNQLCALLKRKIPVLMVTGEMRLEHIQDIEDAGFFILYKPLAPAKLMLFLKRTYTKLADETLASH